MTHTHRAPALPSVEELQNVARNAKAMSAQMRVTKKQEEVEKYEREQARIKTRVTDVLGRVKQLCMEAAAKGEDRIVIYEIPYRESSKLSCLPGGRRHHYGDAPQLHELITDAARIIYDALYEGSLNPTIKHWHDGQGVKGGYRIYANWGELEDVKDLPHLV